MLRGASEPAAGKVAGSGIFPQDMSAWERVARKSAWAREALRKQANLVPRRIAQATVGIKQERAGRHNVLPLAEALGDLDLRIKPPAGFHYPRFEATVGTLHKNGLLQSRIENRVGGNGEDARCRYRDCDVDKHAWPKKIAWILGMQPNL